MDFRAEVDRAVEEMEWGEVVSTLEAAIYDLLADPPPAPSTPLPPDPVGLELNISPEPADGQGRGYGGCLPQGAVPQVVEHQNPFMEAPTMNYGPPLFPNNIVQPGHLFCHQAYRQGQNNDVPVVRLPGGFTQNLRCVGQLNGELLYELPQVSPLSAFAAAPPITSNSKQRKCESRQQDDRPYVKKPPNAFMLFMKEQRPNVEADVSRRGSAAVNAVLGQRWKSLSNEERAKYYEQAESERLLHAQQHPEWTGGENYGKKRKRESRKAPRTRVTEAPRTQTGVMEPCHLHMVQVQLPYT